MIRLLLSIALIGCVVFPTLAQSLNQQADRQFDQLAYAQAADLYERALSSPSDLNLTERRAVLARLAFSYRKLNDTRKAERVYRELMTTGELPAEYASAYLYFAQALASNGNYKEAQVAYEKYGTLQPNDGRGTQFSKLYRDVSVLTKNAGSYRVEFLDLNTRKAEFSPVRYKDGLVFVSAAGTGNGLKRVFSWNNSSFLDLYYLPDVKSLRSNNTARIGGSAPKPPVDKYARAARSLGRDDFTAPTANDTRTVGFYGGNNLNADLGYGDRPVSPTERFSQTLNTKYHEGPATFTKNGSRVIFTRNNYTNGSYRTSKDGINKLKLYTATQINGVWSEPQELPFNSDEFSTGHPALSADDQRLYFVSDRPGGRGGTDIYVSKWTNGKWGQPVNLGPEINTKGSEMFPFVDAKGNLYVASDGHAGLGGLDLFFAQLSDDGSRAKNLRNLGEPLNSAKDDFGIVTDGDRTGGYFSSNRKNGGSDDDVYRFSRQGPLFPCRELVVSVFDAESKEPLANTSVAIENNRAGKQRDVQTDAEGLLRLCMDAESDFYFLASRTGYLANKVGFSTRDLSDDQPSRLDIPLAKPQELKPTTLRGRVLTQTEHQPIAGARVIAVNECDNTVQEATSDAQGVYFFSAFPGCAYTLEAMKENMGSTGSRITKEGVGSTDLYLFKKGDIVKVENIYYDLDKADIRPDAALELDKLVALMAKYPAMTLELRSHTDSRATAKYNETLSGKRAKAVVAYLKKKGVAAKRLRAKGYGETELLNKCADGVNCPDEEHQQNRRTEIKILTLE